MLSVTYPYTRIPTDKGIVYRPIIPIKVIHQEVEFPILGLIDSGADECSFPAVVGEALGHNIKKGKPREFGGVGGKVTAYLHQNILQVENRQFRCDIYFSEKWNNWGFGLLGQHGFFTHFNIFFDYKRRIFKLEYERAEQSS